MFPNSFGANLLSTLCVENEGRSHDDTNSEDFKKINFGRFPSVTKFLKSKTKLEKFRITGL